jgi:hypothetical protein
LWERYITVTILADSLEFYQNFDDPEIFEEAYIPDVDMEATTNVTASRCRRQGTFLVLICHISF